MTSEDLAANPSPANPPAASATRHLIQHFVEMVVAMLVGMAVLGMAVRLALALAGHSALLDDVEARVLVMATNMVIGMSVWMAYRRHGWARIVEMDTAMVGSFAIVLVVFWAGVLPEGAVMMVGHVLMLPAMALVMLARKSAYSVPCGRMRGLD